MGVNCLNIIILLIYIKYIIFIEIINITIGIHRQLKIVLYN